MNTKTTGLLVIALIAVIGLGIFSYISTKKSGIQSSTPQTAEVRQSIATYKDGMYEQIGNYTSPGGAEQIDVKLSLKNGIITQSTVTSEAVRPKSKFMQGLFIANYKQLVVGKNINDLKLGKVAGSSLTPQGFDDALEKIKAEAKA